MLTATKYVPGGAFLLLYICKVRLFDSYGHLRVKGTLKSIYLIAVGLTRDINGRAVVCLQRVTLRVIELKTEESKEFYFQRTDACLVTRIRLRQPANSMKPLHGGVFQGFSFLSNLLPRQLWCRGRTTNYNASNFGGSSKIPNELIKIPQGRLVGPHRSRHNQHQPCFIVAL